MRGVSIYKGLSYFNGKVSGLLGRLMRIFQAQIDFKKRTTIPFFTAVILFIRVIVTALLCRKKMKVGKLATAIVQMQLHAQREQEVATHDGYDPEFFHHYEGNAVYFQTA
jgi:hypothetical protein